MSIITILLFFVYTYGLGYSASFFFKNADDFYERQIMRIGIGLAVIPLIIVLLGLFHIPIAWKILLLLSVIGPLYGAYNKIKSKSFKINAPSLYLIILLIIFGLTVFMYTKGSFAYPYLEDDDPWAHALGAKYVATEMRIDDPTNSFIYITPYPPGYDGLMGILHQTATSLSWTLKFFNALIISLGILFFYYFCQHFMKSKNKAILATAILAMVPSYLSHFIWAHSMVTTAFIVSLYCLVMMHENDKWMYLLILVIAGICLIQPTQPIKYFVMYLTYLIVYSISSKKIWWKGTIGIAGGYLLSGVWWIQHWRRMFSIQQEGHGGAEIAATGIQKLIVFIQRAFPPGSGTATRAYTFSDFFYAKSQNMINNPIGIGNVLCIIAAISLIYLVVSYRSMRLEKKTWSMTALLWTIFAFLGINSLTFHLPIGLFAFRFWMLFALPFSILAAEGIWFIASLLSGFKIPKLASILVLILLVFLTSGRQKYDVNTAFWGPGQSWSTQDEISTYAGLMQLPPNTKVFSSYNDEKVIGFDMFSCAWCEDIIDFRKDLLKKNSSEIYSWLKQHEYEYVVYDASTLRLYDATYGNETAQLLNAQIQDIATSGRFTAVQQSQGAVIFHIT